MRFRCGLRAGARRRLGQCFWCLYLWRRVYLTLFFIIALYIFYWRKTFFRDLDYYVRPLWGHPYRTGPQIIIPHYYSSNLPASNRCALHGWTPRSQDNHPRIIDAFTFSIELDLLEIRLKELYPVVDTFVIVEASRTFQGQPKRLYFQENKERFRWAEDKIRHFVVNGLSENPTGLFENESRMRNYITGFIRDVKPKTGDLIVASDIDEIPSRKALELIKSCQGYPNELHLQVKEYLYSFEFELQTTNWRPHVTIYNGGYWFHHIILSENRQMLADAGWHCSFCFRYLADFVFKMTAYSHSSLVTREDFLDKEHIQRRICQGIDVFEMPPEAYSIKDFVARWGRIPKRKSTLGIPEGVVEEWEKYRFLLPGGCLREDFENETGSTTDKLNRDDR